MVFPLCLIINPDTSASDCIPCETGRANEKQFSRCVQPRIDIGICRYGAILYVNSIFGLGTRGIWSLLLLPTRLFCMPIAPNVSAGKMLCSHVFPGKLTRLLPARKQGPYAIADYFWTAIGLMVLFAFPIPWLWQSKILFFGYGSLLIIGLAEILFLVCRTCSNANCPICSISEQNIR